MPAVIMYIHGMVWYGIGYLLDSRNGCLYNCKLVTSSCSKTEKEPVDFVRFQFYGF